MRLFPILLTAIALATAGCFGGDDGGESGGGDTPPTPTTPATPTPTTPTDEVPEGENETAPETKAPKEVYAETYSFQHAPADPQNAAVTKTFTVEEGYSKLTLNATWSASAPLIVQEGVKIDLAGPDGTVLATCQGPTPGPAPSPMPTCTQEAPISAGGDYQVVYHGMGDVSATVSVIASA